MGQTGAGRELAAPSMAGWRGGRHTRGCGGMVWPGLSAPALSASRARAPGFSPVTGAGPRPRQAVKAPAPAGSARGSAGVAAPPVPGRARGRPRLRCTWDGRHLDRWHGTEKIDLLGEHDRVVELLRQMLAKFSQDALDLEALECGDVLVVLHDRAVFGAQILIDEFVRAAVGPRSISSGRSGPVVGPA